MPDLRQRLIEAVKKSGLTQLQVAAAAGMSQPQLNHYLRGRREPSMGVIRRLAKALGVGVRWLAEGVDDPAAVAAPEIRMITPERGGRIDPGAYYPLPIVSGEVAAGSPSVVQEAEVEDWVPSIYHPDWCPHPADTVCVRVRGDSMAPTIPDGGLVAIDLKQRESRELQNKIVALRIDDGVAIKRLVATGRGDWICRPDNPASTELFVLSDDDIVDAIVGKVVWWWSKAN